MHTVPTTALRLACALTAGLSLAACDSAANNTVRTGPQAVHPSPSALAQGTAPKASPALATSGGNTPARDLFETYCTPGVNNNTRVTAILASGRFAEGNFGKLPQAEFKDVVFLFYTLKGAQAQIGLGSRMGSGNYCVAVDGTATGTELYVTGP